MEAGPLDRAFDALSRAARISGAYRAVSRSLATALGPAGGRGRDPERGGGRPREDPITVLDVGSGRGDLLRHLEEHLGVRGVELRSLGGEIHPVALRLARGRPGPFRLVRLSAPRLPFADSSVDFVVSTITLHHLDRAGAVRFLSEAHRVARRGWIVVDLRRSLPTRLAVRLLAATLWRRNPLPRHDGPVSVRRSFRPEEARELLSRAGVSGASVRASPPLHLTIAGGELRPAGAGALE